MSSPQSDALQQLAHEYWEGVLRRNPILATFYGDYRFNDRLQDIGPEGRAADEAALREVLSRLPNIDQAELSADEVVTWDMLRLACSGSRAADPVAGPSESTLA